MQRRRMVVARFFSPLLPSPGDCPVPPPPPVVAAFELGVVQLLGAKMYPV